MISFSDLKDVRTSSTTFLKSFRVETNRQIAWKILKAWSLNLFKSFNRAAEVS